MRTVPHPLAVPSITFQPLSQVTAHQRSLSPGLHPPRRPTLLTFWSATPRVKRLLICRVVARCPATRRRHHSRCSLLPEPTLVPLLSPGPHSLVVVGY